MNFQKFFVFIIILSSCTPKNLIYLSDLKPSDDFPKSLENAIDPKIQPGDILNITVNTLQQESNLLFNSGIIHSVGQENPSGNRANDGYLVDKNGSVNFPVLGKTVLAGLTREEAVDKMTKDLLRFVKDPIVNIRFQNFKITVIGEVQNPSTYIIPNEKINVLEALGLAGDMTVYGNRKNVLIVREKDGGHSNARLNLNQKDLFTSSYFYLQQNDIVYVEPVKARAAEASLTRSNISIGLSVLTILVFLLN